MGALKSLPGDRCVPLLSSAGACDHETQRTGVETEKLRVNNGPRVSGRGGDHVIIGCVGAVVHLAFGSGHLGGLVPLVYG